MNKKTMLPISIKDVRFDEVGHYEIVDILQGDELDLIGGGVADGATLNKICIDLLCGRNEHCGRNRTCGEDGDDDYEQD